MPEELSPITATSEPEKGGVRDAEMLRIDRGRVPPLRGEAPEQEKPTKPHIEHIPWGYGSDRVTAMAVDPNRLFIYWEISDEAILKARKGLERGGNEAWLNLRVYDVT